MTSAKPDIPQLDVPEHEIRDFCERNHIVRFMLFGSAVREDFRPDSDVDVLVEFDPGHVPGFGFFALQDELAAIFQRDVDLNTWGFLSPHIREDVARDAVTIYDKA